MLDNEVASLTDIQSYGDVHLSIIAFDVRQGRKLCCISSRLEGNEHVFIG